MCVCGNLEPKSGSRERRAIFFGECFPFFFLIFSRILPCWTCWLLGCLAWLFLTETMATFWGGSNESRLFGWVFLKGKGSQSSVLRPYSGPTHLKRRHCFLLGSARAWGRIRCVELWIFPQRACRCNRDARRDRHRHRRPFWLFCLQHRRPWFTWWFNHLPGPSFFLDTYGPRGVFLNKIASEPLTAVLTRCFPSLCTGVIMLTVVWGYQSQHMGCFPVTYHVMVVVVKHFSFLPIVV